MGPRKQLMSAAEPTACAEQQVGAPKSAKRQLPNRASASKYQALTTGGTAIGATPSLVNARRDVDEGDDDDDDEEGEDDDMYCDDGANDGDDEEEEVFAGPSRDAAVRSRS